jgi:hypothetical protein
MTIQASGEPGLVRPLKEAVEKSIKAQIDKGSNTAPSSETHQIALKPGQDVDREETITKISSAEFYQDVGRAVKEILEKRGAKTPPQFLAGGVGKRKDEDEKKEKKGKNDLPPFMKDKGKKEEDAEDEEEEEEEEKPKKGKKKKAEEKEEEEEPKFPIFGKKPKKAE